MDMVWVLACVVIFALLVILYFAMREIGQRVERVEVRAERCVTVRELKAWLETDRSIEEIHEEMAKLRKEAEEKHKGEKAKNLERAQKMQDEQEAKIRALIEKDEEQEEKQEGQKKAA